MIYNPIIHNNKIVCPRCDGNGFLYQTIIEPVHESIIMCDECEAVWPSNSKFINKTNFRDFSTYIQGLGYTYEEVELTAINYNWYSKQKNN
ncbi:MAG: hypothetical protein WCD44_01970 [Candidatus Babeliales bacterium]|jgi:epoxyqueuosine reductase QueG